MFLELTEVMVCAWCRPAQGLIALVSEIRDRRVRSGHLGCPECEARYPVREGLVRFDRPEGPGAPGAAEGRGGLRDGTPAERPPLEETELLGGAGPRERAIRLAALLGAADAGGHLLLGPGLAELAPALSGMVEEVEVEVMALVPGMDADPGEEPAWPPGADSGGDADAPAGTAVTRLAGVDPLALPVVSGRLGGVALLGGTPEELQEAIRVLSHGSRLVVVAPSPEVRDAAEGLRVEVAAADARALVAARTG